MLQSFIKHNTAIHWAFYFNTNGVDEFGAYGNGFASNQEEACNNNNIIKGIYIAPFIHMAQSRIT